MINTAISYEYHFIYRSSKSYVNKVFPSLELVTSTLKRARPPSERLRTASSKACNTDACPTLH